MRAYYFDNIPGDQRLPHDYIPSRPVSAETLASINVQHWTIPVEGYEPTVDAIAKGHGCKHQEVVTVSKEALGEVFEEKMKKFFEEHMHEDKEIRYILSGTGYFDVRESPSEAWIRLAMEPGDLMILPAGIYHRFTLDETNLIRAVRCFQDDDPKHYYRGKETEVNPHRVAYLKTVGVGAKVSPTRQVPLITKPMIYLFGFCCFGAFFLSNRIEVDRLRMMMM